MKKQHTENKNKPESSQKDQAPQKQVGRSLYYPESYKLLWLNKTKKNLCVPYSIKTYNLETNLSNLITKVKANKFKNLYKLFKKKMLKLLLIKQKKMIQIA